MEAIKTLTAKEEQKRVTEFLNKLKWKNEVISFNLNHETGDITERKE